MEETPLTLEQVEHIPTIPRELSSVRIREFDESTANPEPIVQDDEADHLLEEFLSPAKLVSVWWITTVFLRTWTPSVICLSQLWGLRGGRCVHSLNFKSSCFAYWGGSHVPVSILLLFAIFPVTVAVWTYRHVDCRHFICLMSLFQGHITCQNFTLKGLNYHHKLLT